MTVQHKLLLMILVLCLIFDGVAWFITYQFATAPSAEELRQTAAPRSNQ